MTHKLLAVTLSLAATSLAATADDRGSAAISLWRQNKVAFGVFVPRDAPARAAAYANPLYDFLFLNQEQQYDAAVVKSVAGGVQAATAGSRKTLIVRIPPVERDGLDAAKARIAEVFALGADGVAVPRVRDVDEARQVLAAFRDSRANIWSSSNPKGDRLAMLMLEDPGAVAQAKEIADLPGYSLIACGIGSLTQALGGNRAAAEEGNQKVLAESKRAKLVNLLTATAGDVEQRVQQGYLGLIAMGPDLDAVIRPGRKAARRE
jgi:2-keto-3-deoxy-L-rhamnonate aldolase RhmA